MSFIQISLVLLPLVRTCATRHVGKLSTFERLVMLLAKLVILLLIDGLPINLIHLPLPQEHLEVWRRSRCAAEIREGDFWWPINNDHHVTLHDVPEIKRPLHFSVRVPSYLPCKETPLALENNRRDLQKSRV
jgi:hypothetical protein